jgi:hypothetical protein
MYDWMQAATVSLLRIFTDGGRTLCSIPEGRPSLDGAMRTGASSGAAAQGARDVLRCCSDAGAGRQRRSLDSCRQQDEAAAAAALRMSLEVSGRAYSLGLF